MVFTDMVGMSYHLVGIKCPAPHCTFSASTLTAQGVFLQPAKHGSLESLHLTFAGGNRVGVSDFSVCLE